MTALTCPHCGAWSNFTTRAAWRVEVRGKQEFFGVWKCDNCQWPVSGSTNTDDANKCEPKEWHPRAVGGKAFPEVPPSIARDADEAHQCYSIGALRASVTMARRAIQALAIDQGADRNAKLHKQIDQLREAGHITQSMCDVAHEVRLSGNEGAHPDDDPNLDELDEQEAADALALMDELLRHVYQTPARVEHIRARRNKEEG